MRVGIIRKVKTCKMPAICAELTHTKAKAKKNRNPSENQKRK